MQLLIAQYHVEFENFKSFMHATCLLHELKSERLRIEYLSLLSRLNSEMTFKDVSGKIPSYKCGSIRMVICPSGGHALAT